MRYIGHLLRRRRKVLPVRRVLVVLIVLPVCWVVFCEWGLSAVSRELTEEAARGYVLGSINKAVKKALQDGDECIIAAGEDGSGRVTAVSLNTEQLNRIKAEILGSLVKSLNGRADVRIPAGSLTNLALLNGRGPAVPLKLNLEGSADVSFQTEFLSAGLNQSCHRVTMKVTAQVISQSRKFSVQLETETDTVLAETIVVGQALTAG